MWRYVSHLFIKSDKHDLEKSLSNYLRVRVYSAPLATESETLAFGYISGIIQI